MPPPAQPPSPAAVAVRAGRSPFNAPPHQPPLPSAGRPPAHAAGLESAAMAAEALLEWYEEVRRPLPWRFTRDPWAILVSEVMLQQTQAARVVPHYKRFLARFPSPAALAAAPPAEAIA